MNTVERMKVFRILLQLINIKFGYSCGAKFFILEKVSDL